MNFDHVSATTISEDKARAICERLIRNGHEARISATIVLGTRYYTVCWND